MVFNPSDLSTYSNRQASYLLSNALAKLGYSLLGFQNYTEAYSELEKLFWVKANTIKNNQQSFDPHYPTSRQGWHKSKELKPYLQEIKNYTDQISEAELVAACEALRQLEWLPDLEEAIKEGSKKLTTTPTNAALKIEAQLKREYTSFLSARGTSILAEDETALYVRSKKRAKNQYTVLRSSQN